MENLLQQPDDHGGCDADNGSPGNHFQLAPVVHAGHGEQVAQKGDESQKNGTVSDDEVGVLSGLRRQYREQKWVRGASCLVDNLQDPGKAPITGSTHFSQGTWRSMGERVGKTAKKK